MDAEILVLLIKMDDDFLGKIFSAKWLKGNLSEGIWKWIMPIDERIRD